MIAVDDLAVRDMVKNRRPARAVCGPDVNAAGNVLAAGPAER
ncbi:hypothetical protein [Nonomuraea sp. SBT364]|nr:hypothetical protein [Nonomuraea sp. SBT364]